ncbi:hypothetical protein KCP76_24565 [Salmonella enterica subsp. enterica serovar Weltevreden]|nr:hypothetical protein KCP76_24565 [Salmonella enterica subsp. enterica serovar Weltevreden]
MFNRCWFLLSGNFRFSRFQGISLVNLDQQGPCSSFRIIHLSMFRQRNSTGSPPYEYHDKSVRPDHSANLFGVFTRNIQVAANQYTFQWHLFPAGTLTVSRWLFASRAFADRSWRPHGDWRISC